MTTMIAALERELQIQAESYRQELARMARMIEQAQERDREGRAPEQHLSHNLASVSDNLRNHSARFEQTQRILTDLRAHAAVAAKMAVAR